jgi:large subunit ribosomal protein L10
MPSASVLETKAARVAELEEKLKGTVSLVLVDYRGITVADDTVLRRSLREANVEYFVEKNTMLKRALHNIGMEDLDDVLNGTTAIAISSDDQTAMARIHSVKTRPFRRDLRYTKNL